MYSQTSDRPLGYPLSRPISAVHHSADTSAAHFLADQVRSADAHRRQERSSPRQQRPLRLESILSRQHHQKHPQTVQWLTAVGRTPVGQSSSSLVTPSRSGSDLTSASDPARSLSPSAVRPCTYVFSSPSRSGCSHPITTSDVQR
jgi:hypothetical protein